MLAGMIVGAACVCAGAAASYRLYRRAVLLRDWQQAMIAMRAAAVYAHAGCADTLRAGQMAVLKKLAEQVEREGADAAAAYEALGGDALIRGDERAVIACVLRTLSGGGRDEQEAMLSYAEARFSAFCERAEALRDRDARMFVSLGVLCGICALIML